MTTTASENGRARKSLASEIERLHEILNGLSANLHEAVATAVAGAVKEAMTAAVQEAAHAAVVKALANKEVQQRLDATPTPVSQPPVTMAVRLADTARRCWGWLAGAARDTCDTVTTAAQVVKDWALEAATHILTAGRAKAQQIRDRVTAGVRVGWMRLVVVATLARQLRRRLPVALGAGVAVGLVAYLAGPLVVPIACGLAGFLGSLLIPWQPLLRMTTEPDAGP
jgi:hypothetical protein